MTLQATASQWNVRQATLFSTIKLQLLTKAFSDFSLTDGLMYLGLPPHYVRFDMLMLAHSHADAGFNGCADGICKLPSLPSPSSVRPHSLLQHPRDAAAALLTLLLLCIAGGKVRWPCRICCSRFAGRCYCRWSAANAPCSVAPLCRGSVHEANGLGVSGSGQCC